MLAMIPAQAVVMVRDAPDLTTTGRSSGVSWTLILLIAASGLVRRHKVRQTHNPWSLWRRLL